MTNKTKDGGSAYPDYKAALDTIPDLLDETPETAEDVRKRTLIWFYYHYITVLFALKNADAMIAHEEAENEGN